jgi:hypothetical protein
LGQAQRNCPALFCFFFHFCPFNLRFATSKAPKSVLRQMQSPQKRQTSST